MRHDLAAFAPDALAALTNRGFVKRAERMIEDGKGPELDIDDDGSIRGRFPGGVEVEIMADAPLKDARCSCKAVSVCFHIVAVALVAEKKLSGTSVGHESISLDQVSDEALKNHIGKRRFDKAKAFLNENSLSVWVQQSTVHLPSCTVRFLAGGDLNYARCDCNAKGPCEHIALALWAYRNSSDDGIPFILGLPEASSSEDFAFDEARSLSDELIRYGLAQIPANVWQHLSIIRRRWHDQGLRWMLDLLNDLQQQLSAYRLRSSSFDSWRAAALLAELEARCTACDGPLGPQIVLGIGEVEKTRLGRARLISLGCEVRRGIGSLRGSVLLADPDSGELLVAEAEAKSMDELAKVRLVPHFDLQAMAKGQLLVEGAWRLANGRLLIPRSHNKTSLVAQSGDWSHLPESILISDIKEWKDSQGLKPPPVIAARRLTNNFHVLQVGGVGEISYDAGTQRLNAQVFDMKGQTVLLSAPYSADAPMSLDALTDALCDTPRYISGRLNFSAGQPSIEPVSISTPSGVVVPVWHDAQVGQVQVRQVPPTPSEQASTALQFALEKARYLLSKLLRQGLAYVNQATRRQLLQTADVLEEVGMTRTSAQLMTLEKEIKTSQAPSIWRSAILRLLISQSMPS